MNKKLSVLCIALAAALLLAGCMQLEPDGGSFDTDGGSAGILASFTSTELGGDGVDETAFEDYSLVMVNVWATFCTPCIDEMPELGKLSADYADKGVGIVGIVSDVMKRDGSLDDKLVAAAKDIVESTGADYLHILPSEDLSGLLSQISAVPTTFLVDSDGNQVGSAYLGSRSYEEWAEIIDSTLSLDGEEA